MFVVVVVVVVEAVVVVVPESREKAFPGVPDFPPRAFPGVPDFPPGAAREVQGAEAHRAVHLHLSPEVRGALAWALACRTENSDAHFLGLPWNQGDERVPPQGGKARIQAAYSAAAAHPAEVGLLPSPPPAQLQT